MSLPDKTKERFLAHIRAVQLACPLPETATVAILIGRLFDQTPNASEGAMQSLLMLGRVYEDLRKPTEALQNMQLEDAAREYRTNLVKAKPVA